MGTEVGVAVGVGVCVGVGVYVGDGVGVKVGVDVGAAAVGDGVTVFQAFAIAAVGVTTM